MKTLRSWKIHSRSVHSLHAKSSGHPTIARILRQPPSQDEELRVNGHITSLRRQKPKSFAALSDGSTLQPLQIVLTPDQARGLNNGTSIQVTGHCKPSRRPEKQSHELEAQSVKILGEADPGTYPLQKQDVEDHYLRDMPHLRARQARQAMYLRFRSQAMAALSRFFAERDFVQCHTPIITSSDCEGAGEVFGIDRAAASRAGSPTITAHQPFFKTPKYLTVSAQLHLEALAQSVGKVWTLSPTFRAEASETARHQSEFYMLEVEVNYVDRLEEVTRLCEDMIRGMLEQLRDTPVGREAREGSMTYEDAEVVATRRSLITKRWDGICGRDPWPCITYTDAVKALGDSTSELAPPTWGGPLSTDHERYLAEKIGRGAPLFVTHYPRQIKPFYMLPTTSSDASDMQTVDCFDLLLPEVCEVAGGSMREHRLPELVSRMKEAGMVGANDDRQHDDGAGDAQLGSLKWYVDLRRWGSAPHGGFGLGFDRLLAYLLGVQNIREVVAFPRWVGRCDC